MDIDVLFVYGLVIVFFLLLIPVVLFLMGNPIIDMDQAADIQIAESQPKTRSEKTVAYGIIAAVLGLMSFITIFSQKKPDSK